MSVICISCGHLMPHKNNVYGTLCDKCCVYIPPSKKPKFIEDADKRLVEHQHQIRQLLKKRILGEKNGNQVEQKG